MRTVMGTLGCCGFRAVKPRCSLMSSSRLIEPSSTKSINPVAVIALEIEAMRYLVWSFTGRSRVKSRVPKWCTKTGSPSHSATTDMPMRLKLLPMALSCSSTVWADAGNKKMRAEKSAASCFIEASLVHKVTKKPLTGRGFLEVYGRILRTNRSVKAEEDGSIGG